MNDEVIFFIMSSVHRVKYDYNAIYVGYILIRLGCGRALISVLHDYSLQTLDPALHPADITMEWAYCRKSNTFIDCPAEIAEEQPTIICEGGDIKHNFTRLSTK